MQVAVLHPGAMGALVGGSAAADVIWAGAGRSVQTRERATAQGLRDEGSLEAVVGQADVVVSVCPPHAAGDVAEAVSALGYAGIYVDANAISPAWSREIGRRFDRYVDGGLIGPPPATAGTTRLYLSGEGADVVASLWKGSVLEPRVMEGPVGAASALKMAYAGWTKGSAALLLAMRAYAAAEGIGDDLVREWEQSIPELPDRVERVAGGVSPKAWRFTGEMEQIAESLEAAGLPGGFHEAAHEIYARLADLKGEERPTLDEAMRRLGGH